MSKDINEDSSQTSNRELEKIINKSPMVVFLWKNQEGWPVEFVSKSISQFGYKPEEFLSGEISFSEIIHPEDLDRINKEVQKYSAERGKKFVQEYRIITKEGKIKWIDDRTWIRYNENDEITHYQGIILDITQRVESEEKFRLISEQSLVGIFILQNDKVKYVNEKFEQITGYSPREMLKWEERGFYVLFHEDSIDQVREQAEKKQRGEDDIITNYQFKGIKKTGEVFWAEVYSRPIMFQGQYADLGVLLDITEKKKAEFELKESKALYKEAYKRENFYKDLFAHDMNNILQGILTSLELSEILAKSPDKNQEMSNLLNQIQEQVKRASSLVKNVMKFSEISEKDWELKKVKVFPVLKEAVKHIERSFSDKHIKIEILNEKDNLQIKANELLLDVFENILINSVKHNDKQEIEISVKLKEITDKNNNKEILIEFEDNGRGIPDERKEQIFKRMEGIIRQESQSGMGLGLSLVKQIMGHFGGKISVSDRVKNKSEKGAKFTLTFPIL